MSRLCLTSVIVLTLLLLTAAVPAHAQSACPVDETLEQGNAALDVGQYQEAITAFSCVIETDPSNPDAYIGRAEAYVLNGEWFFGFGDYRNASLYVKSNPSWWQRLSARINRLIYSNPSAPEAQRFHIAGHTLQAHMYWYASQDNEALEEYDLILMLDPSNLFALTFRGSSRLYLGMEGYEEDWAQALEIAPENPSVLFFIASTYRGVGDQDKALLFANRALEIAPESSVGYHGRGRIYLAREEYQQAIDDFNHAVELGLPPTTAVEALTFVGQAYLQLNHYEDAVESFQRAEAVMPGSPWVGYLVGYNYDEAGYYEEAASAYLDYFNRLDFEAIQGEMLKIDEPVTIILQSSGWNGYSLAVELKKGQFVQFEANGVSNFYADPFIVLVGPDHAALAANDDDRQATSYSLNAAIHDFIVPDDGLHTLLVTTSLDGSGGRVEVRITEEPRYSELMKSG